MIGQFPDFKRVTLEDKPFFDEFNQKLPPYADWAFGTLMTWWDIFDDLHAASINNNVIIASSYMSMGTNIDFTVLGDHSIDNTLDQLFIFQKTNNETQRAVAVPQYTIDAIQDKDRYIITEDLGAAEYVLSTEMHATFQDTSISKVRRKVQKFLTLTKDEALELTHVPLDTLHAKLMLINSLHTWQGLYKNDRERIEGRAIDRALLIAENIDLHCMCLFINKKLSGFALYKVLPDNNANINHIKVSYDHANIFNYMLHTLAQHLYNNGITHMNIEQDLDIEGLRTFKERMRPVKMMRKYTIIPKKIIK